MARCNDCNKFVGFDCESDPETNVDLEGTRVTGTVEITNCCSECGTEMRTASFDIEVEHDEEIEKHAKDTKQKVETITNNLSFEADDASREEKTEGKGRGQKLFYGFSLNYRIKCDCVVCKKAPNKAFVIEGATTDYIQSSHMDEM